MKTLTYVTIFLTISFANCGQKSATEELVSEPVAPAVPPEWLTIEGQSGSKNIVLVSGDEEYRSEEALPQMAKILATHHGFNCTVLFAQDPKYPGIIDPNYTDNIPGLEALEQADLMVLFTRFRALPDDQMQYIDNYLKSGKPVLALRTATHAFNFTDSTNKWAHYGNFFEDETSEWHEGFGRLVLGERWYTHHGHHKQQSTRGLIAPGSEGHPIATGLKDGDIWGPTDVYGVRLPLPGDSQPIVLGQSIDRTDDFDESDPFYGLKSTDTKAATTSGRDNAYNPNDPMMPIAWTKTYQIPGGQSGVAFTSTIGSSTDMVNDGVRRLLVNATYYLLGQDVPANAKVDLMGDYNPSAYNFEDDEHWDKLNLKIADLVED
ncbi:MAG: ThuA domain-containing protein [Cyclobacteriaceae bacterium]